MISPEWGDEGSEECRFRRQWDLPEPRVGIEFCENLSSCQLGQCLVDSREGMSLPSNALVESCEVNTDPNF